MSKKSVANFSASGSGFGNTAAELQPFAPGAKITETKVLSGSLTDVKIKTLVERG